MNEKKTWIIPVEWSVYSTVLVEADTLEEALDKFNKNEVEMPLPESWEYIDGSFKCCDSSMEYLEMAQEFRIVDYMTIE